MEEDKEKKAKEIYAEYQAIDQNIKQLQKQLEALTSQLMEMNSTRLSLEDLDKVKQGREIFVPINSGIFAKAIIRDTSELLVNVGAGVVVKKDITSTKKLIQNQIDEMKKVHQKMIAELEKMAANAAELEMQLQSMISE